MSQPFRALAPFLPRVIDVNYEAFLLPCDQDITDLTDTTDQSDYWESNLEF